MKKIKKFYADHKRDLEMFLYGAAAASVIGLCAVKQALDGEKLIDAQLLHHNEKNLDFLYVTHANGRAESYLWKMDE